MPALQSICPDLAGTDLLQKPFFQYILWRVPGRLMQIRTDLAGWRDGEGINNVWKSFQLLCA